MLVGVMAILHYILAVSHYEPIISINISHYIHEYHTRTADFIREVFQSCCTSGHSQDERTDGRGRHNERRWCRRPGPAERQQGDWRNGMSWALETVGHLWGFQ